MSLGGVVGDVRHCGRSTGDVITVDVHTTIVITLNYTQTSSPVTPALLHTTHDLGEKLCDERHVFLIIAGRPSNQQSQRTLTEH